MVSFVCVFVFSFGKIYHKRGLLLLLSHKLSVQFSSHANRCFYFKNIKRKVFSFSFPNFFLMFMFLDILLTLGTYTCELYPWGFTLEKIILRDLKKLSHQTSMEIENWMTRCFWKMVLSIVEAARWVRQKPTDLLKSLARYNQEMKVFHIDC